MRKYRLVSKKGEGTFSEVLKAQNVKRGSYHAIKVSKPIDVPPFGTGPFQSPFPWYRPRRHHHRRLTQPLSSCCVSVNHRHLVLHFQFLACFSSRIVANRQIYFWSIFQPPTPLPLSSPPQCMRNHFESIDQVNTLREIQALRRLSPHPHIITLEEVLYDQPTGRLALVFELMDQNLYEVIRGRRHYLSPQLIKIYIYQLLKGLEHMHRKGIFHRDIKVRRE